MPARERASHSPSDAFRNPKQEPVENVSPPSSSGIPMGCLHCPSSSKQTFSYPRKEAKLVSGRKENTHRNRVSISFFGEGRRRL